MGILWSLPTTTIPRTSPPDIDGETKTIEIFPCWIGFSSSPPRSLDDQNNHLTSRGMKPQGKGGFRSLFALSSSPCPSPSLSLSLLLCPPPVLCEQLVLSLQSMPPTFSLSIIRCFYYPVLRKPSKVGCSKKGTREKRVMEGERGIGGRRMKGEKELAFRRAFGPLATSPLLPRYMIALFLWLQGELASG